MKANYLNTCVCNLLTISKNDITRKNRSTPRTTENNTILEAEVRIFWTVLCQPEAAMHDFGKQILSWRETSHKTVQKIRASASGIISVFFRSWCRFLASSVVLKYCQKITKAGI